MKHKLYVCNFADEGYKSQQQFNTKSAYDKGRADKVIEFHPEDLFDNGVIHAHDTNNWEAIDWYMWYEQMCEIVYNNLHKLGQTAQQCSNILTFSTKTQSVHTAFVDDWKHYCLLRSDEISGKVRPEVKLIADKIKELL